MTSRNTFHQVNRALGASPTIAFLPAALLGPAVIAVCTARLAQGLLGLTILQSLFVVAFVIATWWLVTGGNNFRYLSRYARWFMPCWQRGARRYTPWTHPYDSQHDNT